VASASNWMDVPANKLSAEQKVPKVAKEYVVNLDLPQEERWKEIGHEYADRSFMLVNYLKDNLPDGWLPPLEKLAAQLMPFFTDYGDEMKGYADALGLNNGDVVMFNLVYQLEHLGLKCGSANTTGPSPCGDKLYDVDKIWTAPEDGPGLCTSFVACDVAGTGAMYHGRNLDWNLPNNLKQFIIDVTFTRSGKEVYKATTIVGYIGILHAVKPGAFSWSMDARRKGGSIVLNLIEALTAENVRTPEQHARYVFETETTYNGAVAALSSHNIVNQVYYIVSGTKYPEGTVIARDREGVASQYNMEDTIAGQQNWYVGITNYDLEYPPPPSDNRSGPLTENLNALAGKPFNEEDVRTILNIWPTLNQHSDIQAVITPHTGVFDVVTLYDVDM